MHLLRRALVAAAGCAAIVLIIALTAPNTQLPGKMRDGRIRLPNGWAISPVGRPVTMGVGALTMALSPDGSTLAVLNCGCGAHSVMLVDTASEKATETIPVGDAWVGIAFHPDGKRLFVSGGSTGNVWEIRFGSKSDKRTLVSLGDEFLSGVAVSPDGNSLYVGSVSSGLVYKVDLATKKVVATAHTAGRVYGVMATDEAVFATDWLRGRLFFFDPDLNLKEAIAVGKHPTEMARTSDERLFIPCSEDNTVAVVSIGKREVEERLSVSVEPNSPEGSSPSSAAVSRDGQRLYVAVADNNAVAVADITDRGKTRLLGFIPSGWYPCAVAVAADGKRIFSLCSKGTMPKANPNREYIGTLLKSDLYFIPTPTKPQLVQLTREAIACCPYRTRLQKEARRGPASVLPSVPGANSPIRYVVYVIKENRTYDQVFGDDPRGNGDAKLCIFGEIVTPNQHKLAREYVLLDNFYVDAEVSADGHNWSVAAYANDYVEKTWPYNYGGHGGDYDFEGQNPLAQPSGGYIWDACRWAGISYRSYGEYVDDFDEGENQWHDGTVPGLKGHVAPKYPSWNLAIKDVTRYEAWLKEFREFENQGDMPRFQIVRLPQNHTAGTRPGGWTPRAMVADNDLALGKLVDTLSHSRFWKQTAVFVVEDDAQNGPDHVDAHRSPCLVISPYTRLGVADHTMYTTCSVIRTMELLLGARPLNQYDAAAMPMYSLFRGPVNPRPFDSVPAKISTEERNQPTAPMARESMTLDLREADRIDMALMNKILYADATAHRRE